MKFGAIAVEVVKRISMKFGAIAGEVVNGFS